jgi:MerR family transcriptional regulator, thiopeptide resistance regulator
MDALTVGALARRTGLTVRTLHHYDEVGLLSPSERSEGGYRLYSHRDIQRLERIVVLKNLGMALDRIASALDADAAHFIELLEQQAARVESQIGELRRAQARLAESIAQLRDHACQTVEESLELLGAVATFARYLDDEQRDALRARAQVLGPDRIRAAEAQWVRLISDVRRELDAGTSPGDLRVLALAEEWQSLLDEFVNGRWDVAAGAGRMMNEEPSVQRRMASIGLDAEVMDYVARAMAHLSS